MSDPAVRLVGLKKSYMMGQLEVPVLRGIDLEIAEGEWLAVLGRSGSGKTTLLNQIGLLDLPSAGRVLIGGLDSSALSSGQRSAFRLRSLGFIFQFFNLLPELRAVENVKLPMQLAGLPEKKCEARARELLNFVGLGDKLSNLPSQLSGGEMQRVAIARAVANKPKLILADEPTGNLDSENERIVIRLLGELHREGRTIVLVTHNLSLAKHATRIVRLEDGLIVEKE